MLFIRLLRFLRGYICFSASDGFPERFLNLCNQAGVAVWEIAWQKNAMQGRTDRRGFKAMAACAESAGITLCAERNVGLPFLLYNHRQRSGLLAGLLLCVATLWALSGMVWSIEVRGNTKVASEDVLAVMESLGLRQGVWRQSLNARAMSAEALRQLPGVSWISLNLRGATAVIELREELVPDLKPPNTPQDIVAKKAGQLVVMEVYAGSREARAGQAVLQGDVLAGARVTNADASTRRVRANAYAVARTNVLVEAFAPRTETLGQLRRRKTHYTLCFLWFRVPLGPRPKDAGMPLEDRFNWVTGGGRSMPLTLERRTFFATEPAQRIKNDRQLRLAAANAFFDASHAGLRAAQILSQTVEVRLAEEACVVALEGRAYENIGTGIAESYE